MTGAGDDPIRAAIAAAGTVAPVTEGSENRERAPARADRGGAEGLGAVTVGATGEAPKIAKGLPRAPGDDDGALAGEERCTRRDDAVAEMNGTWAFVLVGSNAVVIHERRDGPIQDRTRVISLAAFRAYHLNREVRYWVWKTDDDTGERVRVWRAVKAAPLWLGSPERRTYMGVEFHPDPRNAAGMAGYFNLWRGYAVAPDPAPSAERARKYATFRDHLLVNICAGDAGLFEWLWHWFAHMVQRPRERIGTAVVLRGKMGTGKTIAGEVIGSLFPSHYFLVDDPRYLTGQFNAHMASCILLQVDEGFWAGDKAAEGRLKGLVTAREQMIEAKGVDPIRLVNYVRLMFSSNEGWVVPAGLDERRFAVLDVSDHCAQRHAYFGELMREIDAGGREALLADLLAVDLDAPGAPNLRIIPKTAALLDQKIQSLDHVTSWLFERLVAGAQTRRGAHWRDAVPIETLFDDYIRAAERVGVRRRSEATAFGLRIHQVLPGLRVVKRTETITLEDGRSEARRVNCYAFPKLAECRAAFVAAVGQTVDWGRYGAAEDEGEGDGSRENWRGEGDEDAF